LRRIVGVSRFSRQMPTLDVPLPLRKVAWALGVNPVSARARCTRSTVEDFNPGCWFNTRDTVVRASPT
jgi:hypothetical protein